MLWSLGALGPLSVAPGFEKGSRWNLPDRVSVLDDPNLTESLQPPAQLGNVSQALNLSLQRASPSEEYWR